VVIGEKDSSSQNIKGRVDYLEGKRSDHSILWGNQELIPMIYAPTQPANELG